MASNKSSGAVNSRTVTGHVVQNQKVAKVNSRVEKAHFGAPDFAVTSQLANRKPNTDRRRFVVTGHRK